MAYQTVAEPTRMGVMDEAEAALDALLSLWHDWQTRDKGVRGFNSRALLIGDTRAMRVQYEAQIERQDDEHDALRCKAVDFQVGHLDDPYRTAIHFLARNLSTGKNVWHSPRLPTGTTDLFTVVSDARGMLRRRLQTAGVL